MTFADGTIYSSYDIRISGVGLSQDERAEVAAALRENDLWDWPDGTAPSDEEMLDRVDAFFDEAE